MKLSRSAQHFENPGPVWALVAALLRLKVRQEQLKSSVPQDLRLQKGEAQ